jgi:hypothetical protein
MGQYAVIGQGYEYQVFDISNPSSPSMVYDTTLEGSVIRIEVHGSLLVIGLARTVLLCHSSSLYPLSILGRYDLPGGFVGEFSISDSLLFIGAHDSYLYALNISDPRQPVLRATVAVDGPQVIGLDSRGRFVYYKASQTVAFRVLEFVPDSGFRIGGFLPGAAGSLYVSDTLLFIGTTTGLLRIFSITDPWVPRLLGDINLGARITRIQPQGSRVYAHTQNAEIVVVDISDIGQPRPLIARPTGLPSVNGCELSSSSAVLVAALYRGLKVYSIEPSDTLVERHYFPTSDGPYDVIMKGSSAIVSCWTVGIRTLDLSDPLHPKAKALLPTLGAQSFLDLSMSGDIIACLSNSPHGVTLARFSDSSTFSFLSFVPLANEPQSVALQDSLLLVGVRDSVLIFSAANPTQPIRLSSWSANNFSNTYVNIAGLHAYVSQSGGTGNGGVKILDISTPSSPTQVSSILSSALRTLIVDSLAYVATGNGLVVLNVSDPTAPFTVGSTTTSGTRSYVYLSKHSNLVYMSYDALHIVDVTNPSNPTEIYTLNDLDLEFPAGLSVVRDTVYLAVPFTGLWVLNNRIATTVDEYPSQSRVTFSLSQNYPNPFNPTTTITFALPVKSFVSLKIFDVLGREVATLVSEELSTGKYSTQWNAAGLGSGVYFYRLQAGSFMETKKLLLLR